ncbi:Multi Antimicrobial Extrusion [Paratrimastix pyriformis]|uniref:Multi Antimicrobial Extrusion n=1 Tax=Paratrimastix pyriformis TaxID=342808 RepID=A0ABQ8U7V5_9EUKA|nr:Multi Antimicrobial Extrusion [Paratrimastix pyriformis]
MKSPDQLTEDQETLDLKLARNIQAVEKQQLDEIAPRPSPNTTPSLPLYKSLFDFRGVGSLITSASPLLLAELLATLQILLEQILISRYSLTQFGGQVTAAACFYCILGLFTGTVASTAQVVANHVDQPAEIGMFLWQALYISFFLALVSAALLPLGILLFRSLSPAVTAPYAVTFSVVMHASTLVFTAKAALSSFFAGRGKTIIPLCCNMAILAVELALGICWVNGYGLPAGGIAGLAWTVVIANGLAVLLLAALVFVPPELWRMLRAGFPLGFQQLLDRLPWAVYLLSVGTLGVPEAAAAGIVLRLKQLVLVPLGALANALQVQILTHILAINAGSPVSPASSPPATRHPVVLAHKAFRRLSFMTLALGTVLMATTFGTLSPAWGLHRLWMGADEAAMMEDTGSLCSVLLRYATPLTFLEGCTTVFAAPLRATGSAFYVQFITLLSQGLVFLLPALVMTHYSLPVFYHWIFLVLSSAVTLGFVALRYWRGAWSRVLLRPPPARRPPQPGIDLYYGPGGWQPQAGLSATPPLAAEVSVARVEMGLPLLADQ